MIFTDRKITIRNGKSSINEPVILYRGDFEVSIRFTIMESKFRFKSGVNLVDSEKASHGQLAILAPYGGNVFSEVVKCEDGTVTFTLTKEMIDQLEEVGLYSFQIRLFDYYRESRVSIPPVEFGIEVREPVASEDHDNSVNNAIVGYSIAKVVNPKEENVGPTFDVNGQYNKTDWETGDRISQGKLNKIEDAIDKINQNEKNDVAALDKRVTNNYNILESTKADRKEVNSKIWGMANMGQDVKEAMTGGSVAIVGKNSVLNENITENSISLSKLNFIETIGINLVNPYDVEYGVMYKGYNGEKVLKDTVSTTGFIQVYSGMKLYQSFPYEVTYWDANYNYVSGDWSYSRNITVPYNDNIRYARFLFDINATDYIVKLEANIDKPYEKFKLQINSLNVTNENLDDGIVLKDSNIESISPNKIDGVDEVTSINLFDKTKATSGYFDGTGNFIESSSWMVSDYIEVDINSYYIQKTIGYVTFWSKNKEFVTSASGNNLIKVPNDGNIKYVRIITTRNNLDSEMLIKGKIYPSDYIPHKVMQFNPNIFKLEHTTNKLKGLKWNAMGDSITYSDDSYYELICEEFEIKGNKYGVNGRSIASRGDAMDKNYPPVVYDYINMSDDADIITVFAGVNDFHSSTILGDINSVNPDEFYGALNIIAEGLIEKYKGKKIAFITPMQRRTKDDIERKHQLTEYVEAIKEVGSKYGIPVFDLFANCGLYPNNDNINNLYFKNGDGLHPNAEGYKVFYNRIAKFLESL